MSESRRQSEHINHIGQVKRETMDRRDCMRMQIVMERRESMKGETMDRRNSMKMEMVIDKKDSMKMVMDRRERMKGLQLGVTHRRHKDHELCFMEASFRVQ
jgi:hypothetical protein